MEAEQIVEHLLQISAFKDLDYKEGELELYRLADIANEATHEAGEWLFSQGEFANRLYLILEGTVRLTRVDRDGVTRHLQDVGPGTSFGLTGLLVGDFHDATAAALTDVHILYLERDSFAEIYRERPRLRRKLNVPPDIKRRQAAPDFKWLRPDELVIFAERRHWAHLLRRIFPPLALLGILIPLLYFLVSAGTLFGSIIAVVLGLFALMLVIIILWGYVDWRDDNFVLTTQRVVHIEQVWPISELFEESTLESIQDIHEVQTGIAANILNFGDVILQTAGETVQIDLMGVDAPERLRELIFREIERNKARDILRMRGAIREKLESRLFMEAPPPPVEPFQPPATKPFTIGLVVGALKDYFFPASWSVSADNTTIYWRRFWLPGFFRYLTIFIPLALITFGGLLYLPSYLQASTQIWPLAAWLIMEGALFGALLWFIEDWRNDYFEATPNRVIQVDRKPLLLQESRRETTFDRIQNISFDVPGIVPRIFQYGHVMLETAGATGKFEIKWVRFPDKVQAELSKRQREYAQHKQEIEAQQRQEEMLSWFTTYHHLRQENPKKSTPTPEPPAEA